MKTSSFISTETLAPPPRHRPLLLFTFQIQVLGAHGGLRGDFGVDLDHVEVVGVPGNVHVVPVVVV